MSEPDTRLIESLAQRRGEMWAEVDNGNHDAVELAARFNLPREDVQTAITARRKKGKPGIKKRRHVPVDKPADQQQPENNTEVQQDSIKTAQKDEKYSQPITARAVGGSFVALGLIGSFVGGWINLQFGYEAAGVPGAMIGIVVDGGAALLLVAAGELLRQWNPLGVLALILWFPFVAGSSYAALNYTGTRLGDYFQGRSAVEQRHAVLEGWIKDATGKLGTEKRSVGEITSAIRVARSTVPDPILKATNECQTPTLPKSREACQAMSDELTALDHAKARDGWQEKIDGWNRELGTLAPVASANPAADQVVQMSEAIGSKVTAEQATSWWLRWLAVVPGIGGSIMLAIGAALITGQSRQATSRTSKPQT